MKGQPVNKEPHQLQPGEYAKCGEDGNWYAVPPGTDLVANLSRHKVEEHADGTISVSPSIDVQRGWGDKPDKWHGYLDHGEWRLA